MSCSQNKGCVCSFCSGGVQKSSSNLATPAWDLTKTWGSKQGLYVCDGGQPLPQGGPCQNTGRAGVGEAARRTGFSCNKSNPWDDSHTWEQIPWAVYVCRASGHRQAAAIALQGKGSASLAGLVLRQGCVKASDTHVVMDICSCLPGCARLGAEQELSKHLVDFMPGDCPREG